MKGWNSEKKYIFPQWLKWSLLIILFIFFIIIGYSTYLYINIQETKTEGFKETEDKVLDETNLTSIDEITRFHGDMLYHVVSGETSENEKLLVYVPKEKEDTSHEMVTVNYTEIKPKDDILKQWKSTCDGCKISRIIPAIIDNHPLWEITYYDQSNRYVIEYLSIDDGSPYERLRLKKMFE